MFYSQQLDKHTIENTCSKCEVHFPRWAEYHAHVVTGVCQRKLDVFKPAKEPIRPIKTTNRSKAQIVLDIEKTWGSALIPEVKPWHSLGGK